MVLPEKLVSEVVGVRLERFQSGEDAVRVAALFMDSRVWSVGFDACGAGQPDSLSEALALTEALYSEGFFYSIWCGDVWVGTTGVLSFWEDESVSVGRTLIDPDWWGKGVNLAAKKLLLSCLFETGVKRVRATAISSNTNSLKALSKVGFVELSRKQLPNRYTGGVRDTVNLSLNLAEWANKSES